MNEVEWRVALDTGGPATPQRLGDGCRRGRGNSTSPIGGVPGLLELQRDAMIRALELERTLFSLAETVERAGLDMVVLKGPALARTLPERGVETFGDLDLLVRAEVADAACGLLRGERVPSPVPTEPRPGFSKRFGRHGSARRGRRLEVDLHRTLVSGPFGLWIEPHVLFEHTDTFRLGGKAFRRLDDSALFLHACVHASLGHGPPLLFHSGTSFGQSSPARSICLRSPTCRRAGDSAPWVQHACTTAWETLGVRVSMKCSDRTVTPAGPTRAQSSGGLHDREAITRGQDARLP